MQKVAPKSITRASIGRFVAGSDGCIDTIFSGSVSGLHDDNLELTVIHGDGTTTPAKKGGDNLGYSGHKQKGAKVVAAIATATSWRHS
jgi:hypothetical protein